MINLRETEAVEYLGRLGDLLKTSRLCPNFLKASIQVQHMYLQRLNEQPELRSLACVTISASGFPELPSMVVDRNKAYEDLQALQNKISGSYFTIHQRLRDGGTLAGYQQDLERLQQQFDADNERIKPLTDLESTTKGFLIEPVPLPYIYKPGRTIRPQIFINSSDPELLYYVDDISCQDDKKKKWHRRAGYLKYIDSVTSSPRLIADSKREILEPGEPINVDSQHLEILPDSEEIKNFLESLDPKDPGLRERFLLVDFTNQPDGSFDKFIEDSSKIPPILLKIHQAPQIARPSAPSDKKSEPWWRFGRK